MPFGRRLEERAYQRRLLVILEAHLQDTLTLRSTFPIYDLCLGFAGLVYPFFSLRFITNP